MDTPSIKRLISVLGFSPKENAAGIYSKKYTADYAVEIDFKNQKIHYGERIKTGNKTTQNFSMPENFVVLECVNRLLETGYQPEHIELEKTWRTGRGTSGKLDILVSIPGQHTTSGQQPPPPAHMVDDRMQNLWWGI